MKFNKRVERIFLSLKNTFFSLDKINKRFLSTNRFHLPIRGVAPPPPADFFSS
ncbi:hypothetical protein Bca4012_037143 [Brassica carinata]